MQQSRLSLALSFAFFVSTSAATVAAAQSLPPSASQRTTATNRDAVQPNRVEKERIGISGIITGKSRTGTEAASRSATNYGTLPGTGGQFGGATVAGPLAAPRFGNAARPSGGSNAAAPQEQ